MRREDSCLQREWHRLETVPLVCLGAQSPVCTPAVVKDTVLPISPWSQGIMIQTYGKPTVFF